MKSGGGGGGSTFNWGTARIIRVPQHFYGVPSLRDSLIFASSSFLLAFPSALPFFLFFFPPPRELKVKVFARSEVYVYRNEHIYTAKHAAA